ncbi:MAG: chorismate synthase, partial [Capnocytophaga granulosa]
YSAGIQDRVGVRAFLVRLFLRFECLKTVFMNGGYSGRLINRAGEVVQFQGKGRHDPCVVPRAVPIVEAMSALVLADYLLIHNAYKEFS